MNRRWFLKSGSLALTILGVGPSFMEEFASQKSPKQLKITQVKSNFEREKLLFPFGFKGGYLTELWQVVSKIETENGFQGIGLATQSVLYGDSELFASTSESEGNALMYVLVGKALNALVGRSFESPIQALETILPQLVEEGKIVTGSPELNINFLFNALVSVDNSLWMAYAKDMGTTVFSDLVPARFKKAVSYQNSQVAVMFQISYGMPLSTIQEAVEDGYFIFKIKTGQAGNEAEMLEKDKKRLFEIHQLLKDLTTKQTTTGKVFYTLDANGRYSHKKSIQSFLDFAKEIGAFEHILLYEEPFVESNQESVSDLGIIIAADESVQSVEDAEKKIKLGYQAFAVKPIAKTVSETLKILELAEQHQIPCLCADLTVNPMLVEWSKLIAASIRPFPGLGMGLMETNGEMNYKNWEEMKARHPFAGASWTKIEAGKYHLDRGFFDLSGGVFQESTYYSELV